MDGRVKRCECCGQTIPPPLPLCECGHPMNSHHATAKGNITYCTTWGPKVGMGTSWRQCDCKKAKEQT